MTDFERQLLADVQKMKSGHKVLVSLIWALALVLMFTIGRWLTAHMTILTAL